MKLISIDFDGTIVKSGFPNIGEPMTNAFVVMKKLQEAKDENGKNKFALILNTCREDTKKRKYLTEAIEFCKQNGIIFLSINETHKDYDFRDNGGRKVYAHYYIDDRNLGGFPGWDEVEKLLLGE